MSEQLVIKRIDFELQPKYKTSIDDSELNTHSSSNMFLIREQRHRHRKSNQFIRGSTPDIRISVTRRNIHERELPPLNLSTHYADTTRIKRKVHKSLNMRAIISPKERGLLSYPRAQSHRYRSQRTEVEGKRDVIFHETKCLELEDTNDYNTGEAPEPIEHIAYFSRNNLHQPSSAIASTIDSDDEKRAMISNDGYKITDLDIRVESDYLRQLKKFNAKVETAQRQLREFIDNSIVPDFRKRSLSCCESTIGDDLRLMSNNTNIRQFRHQSVIRQQPFPYSKQQYDDNNQQISKAQTLRHPHKHLQQKHKYLNLPRTPIPHSNPRKFVQRNKSKSPPARPIPALMNYSSDGSKYRYPSMSKEKAVEYYDHYFRHDTNPMPVEPTRALPMRVKKRKRGMRQKAQTQIFVQENEYDPGHYKIKRQSSVDNIEMQIENAFDISYTGKKKRMFSSDDDIDSLFETQYVEKGKRMSAIFFSSSPKMNTKEKTHNIRKSVNTFLNKFKNKKRQSSEFYSIKELQTMAANSPYDSDRHHDNAYALPLVIPPPPPPMDKNIRSVTAANTIANANLISCAVRCKVNIRFDSDDLRITVEVNEDIDSISLVRIALECRGCESSMVHLYHLCIEDHNLNSNQHMFITLEDLAQPIKQLPLITKNLRLRNPQFVIAHKPPDDE